MIVTKDFLLNHIAKLSYGNKFDKNKMNYNHPSINFVSRTSSNNGVSDYVDKIDNVEPFKSGSITLAFGGSVGSTFLQDSDFYTGQNVGVIEFGENISHAAKLYIVTCIEKVCKQRFVAFSDEINKHFKTDLAIELPIKVDENGNPIIDDTHFYHEEGFVPDFDYMQERIEELEQERIEELEQYLVATGLNDYELTDEDIETHSLSGFGHYEERDSEDAVKVCKEFKVSDLFELQKVSNKLAKEDLSDEYEYPAYSSDTGNNGIIGYTDTPEFICNGETPVYITFGDHTRTLNIARKSFSVLDNVKVLIPCYDNEEVLLYLTSEWQKQIPNLGYARHWKVAKDCILSLPIQTDAEGNPIIDTECKYHPDGYIPDWDFMERYIRVIEKIVIADVVKYKDAVISKTKEVVA